MAIGVAHPSTTSYINLHKNPNEKLYFNYVILLYVSMILYVSLHELDNSSALSEGFPLSQSRGISGMNAKKTCAIR